MIDAQIRIRLMEDADIDEVVKIDKASFSLPWPERSFRFEIHENHYSLPLVAEATSTDGTRRIAGFTVIWVIIDEAHIGTIAVSEEYRKQGIAEQLIRNGLNTAAIKGAESALLEVRRSNEAAIHLYQKLGFTVDGVREKYYQDNHEDAILMSLSDLKDF